MNVIRSAGLAFKAMYKYKHNSSSDQSTLFLYLNK